MPAAFPFVRLLWVLILTSVSTLCMADFNILAEHQQCDALVNKYEKEGIEQRAEGGGAREGFCLGAFYEWGTHGYSRLFDQAAKWYEASANRGYPASGYYLGQLYERGQGVPQDNQKAVEWYRVSADLGNALGKNALGAMLQTGYYLDVEENHAEAAKWFHEALFDGYSFSGVSLGFKYRNGDGVPKDVVVGHALVLYAEMSTPVAAFSPVTIDWSKKNLSDRQVEDAEMLYRQMRSLGVKTALESYFMGHTESYCARAPDNNTAYLAFPHLCASFHP